MSDWGAVHSTVPSALAGLDLESGQQLDTENFFEAPLTQALADGAVPQARLDNMAKRILTSIFASGLYDDPPRPGPIDTAASDRTALEIAQKGAVLLKNENLLPISRNTIKLAVIGAHADKGVLSGGGSSQVVPHGGIAAVEPSKLVDGDLIFDPSSPLEAIRRQMPRAQVEYDDGRDPMLAAAIAANADIAIVFADQWMTETTDAPDLELRNGQDELIDAVIRANPHTVVVLETGGPVLMPWLEKAPAVLEAWYPGQKGGEAIAEILSGAVNPSGRLPITFPASEAQLPHPKVQGDPKGAPIGPVGRGGHYGAMFAATYNEGAAVGYKWFFERGEQPLFPFGFGLSYTRFVLSELAVNVSGHTVTAKATVRNSGDRAGTAVPQFYLTGPSGANILRLVGWDRVDLQPGEHQQVAASIDPRLLATFDEGARRWRILAGAYQVSVGFESKHRGSNATFELQPASLPP